MKKYDGKVGKFRFRAGRTCGCYNLFLNGKFKKAITFFELAEMQRKKP
jgi:hypothetical protein